jgi:arylsulfatase A-like enzyme
MPSRTRLLGLTLLANCLACQSAPPALYQKNPPPNILLILADDLGYADCGFTGSVDVLTPQLDALATAGVVFTDAHVSASVCAPSRAGLLTGLYQQRFGFECNLGGGDGNGLPPGQATVASLLQDAGYTTVAIGKWHQGYGEGQHPLDLGFEHFTGLLGGARSYYPIPEQKLKAHQRIERDRVPLSEDSFEYMTDFFSAEALGFVERQDPEKPLFMYLSYTAPHGPNHARPDLFERYGATIPNKGRRTYASMVSAMDEGIGRVRLALEQRGELDNTLIVFLSDNGGATGNHSDNGPWRGMKGSKWEGGQRVPFLLHWPVRLNPGRFGGLTSSLDLLPSALAAAGAPVERDSTDGVDLMPHLLGEDLQAPHDSLFWRRAVAAAVRVDNWKLIRVRETDGRYRAPILVDLAAAPSEQVNAAASQPELVKSLTSKLQAWERELMDPRWLEGERWENNQRLKHEMDLLGRAAERRIP